MNAYLPGVGDRLRALTLFVLILCLAAVLGSALHELGHALHAWATGGRVVAVDLLPWRFSSTVVVPNPRNPKPLVVAWGGPIWGCLLPLAIWGLVRWRWRGREHLARAFAGACLFGNGIYLGAGWVQRVGDAGDLLRHGQSVWVLIAFGLIAVICAAILWNGLAARFVLASGKEILGVLGILIGVIAIELLLRPILWPE